MGPPPDPDQMISMLENPQFQSTMNEALQNPQLIDMMIQQNPMLRDMGPGVRQMMQSPAFRRMLTDPNAIRQMTQMQRAMGMGDLGQPGGNEAFPAPGVTNTTPEENRGTQDTAQNNTTNPAQLPPNPFAALGGQGAAGNPFAALFGSNGPFGNNPAGGQTQGQGAEGDSTGSNPPNPFGSIFNAAGLDPSQQGAAGANANPQNPQAPPDFLANLRQNNPFLQDPALLSQVMQAMGGQNQGTPGAAPADGAQNPFASFLPQMAGGGGGGFGAPQAPADTRPPEERYEEQLRQLNDMGFYEFERNVEALRRAGGSVQGAVEYLLTH
jgi:ubiquilin